LRQRIMQVGDEEQAQRSVPAFDGVKRISA
jgi:hypothetical protein